MNCVGSSEYMIVFTSFSRASFFNMQLDQSSSWLMNFVPNIDHIVIILPYCRRFSLSHQLQNHSTNKVKNQRRKRRWIFEQCRKDSGLCMFVSLWGAHIWRPEANKNICHRVLYKEPVAVFWGPINIYMRTYPHARTVQIVKSQRISSFF